MWDQKTILLDTGKLAFKILNNFEIFRILTKNHKNRTNQIMVAGNPLSFGEQTTIRSQIPRGRYRPRNHFEQIYSFMDISSLESHQLTQMPASSRKCNFFSGSIFEHQIMIRKTQGSLQFDFETISKKSKF